MYMHWSYDGTSKANLEEHCVEFMVPFASRLLGSIERANEVTDTTRVIVIHGRLSHVELLTEMAVQVHTNNVDNLHVKVESSANSEEDAQGLDAYDGCKGFDVVDARNLGESLGNKSSLVLDNASFGVAFETENPLAANGLAICRTLRECVRPDGLELMNLAIHCSFPLRPVWAQASFVE